MSSIPQKYKDNVVAYFDSSASYESNLAIQIASLDSLLVVEVTTFSAHRIIVEVKSVKGFLTSIAFSTHSDFISEYLFELFTELEALAIDDHFINFRCLGDRNQGLVVLPSFFIIVSFHIFLWRIVISYDGVFPIRLIASSLLFIRVVHLHLPFLQ